MNASAPKHDDTTSIAIIETKLDALALAFGELKGQLATSTTVHVTRAEWELRNTIVDERFQATTTRMDATDKRADTAANDAKSRRAPWWSAGAFILAAIALGWTILGPVITR